MSDTDEGRQSYIVKAPDAARVFETPHKEMVADFLEQPGRVIAESVTGALASGPIAWGAMAGRLVQAALKGQYFRQFAAEIEELRKKGRIADDWPDNKQGFQTWVELMTVIDEESPDEERLDALKAMFFAVNKINLADTERIVAYQLFQIAKRLTSGELLLLRANYDAYRSLGIQNHPHYTHQDWLNHVVKMLGHNLTSLVTHHEKALAEHNLIVPRVNSGAAVFGMYGRLTDLGIRFCQNIETYQAMKNSAK